MSCLYAPDAVPYARLVHFSLERMTPGSVLQSANCVQAVVDREELEHPTMHRCENGRP